MGAKRPATQIEQRQQIRLAELEQAIRFIPPGSRVLEVGAGAGWQAAKLADHGFEVFAIDIPQSNYTEIRMWQVQDYDGVRIPLADESVDVVFSSNVLEHIPHIESFQREMQRVLVPGGIAIHFMPTAAWRFWTNLTFFFDRGKKLVLKVKSALAGRKSIDPLHRKAEYQQVQQADSHGATSRGPFGKLRRVAMPATHGARGNFATELYWFSARYWKSLFQRTGWKLLQAQPNGLFYSGQRLFGPVLDLRTRNCLSRVLGSSCRLYVLQKSSR